MPCGCEVLVELDRLLFVAAADVEDREVREAMLDVRQQLRALAKKSPAVTPGQVGATGEIV